MLNQRPRLRQHLVLGRLLPSTKKSRTTRHKLNVDKEV